MITWKDFALSILASSYIAGDSLVYEYNYIDSGIDFNNKLSRLTKAQQLQLKEYVDNASKQYALHHREIESWIASRKVTKAVFLELLCRSAYGFRTPPQWVVTHQEAGTYLEAICLLYFSFPKDAQGKLRTATNNRCWKYRYNNGVKADVRAYRQCNTDASHP